MRRRKRFTIIRIGLALTALAMTLPAPAQADYQFPTPGSMPADQIQAQYQLGPGEIPYKSSSATSNSTVEVTPVASDDGLSIDVNPYAVTGFGLALLLVMGTGLAIRQSRKHRLSPA